MTEPTVTATDALRALQARGVDAAEGLLEFADPEHILLTCEWWDRKALTQKVGPGLLVSRVRMGGVDVVEHTSPKEIKRQGAHERFERIAAKFPPGSVAESHRRLQERVWPGDKFRCAGFLVVIQNDWPMLVARCDTCALEAAYPVRLLSVLPDEPVVEPQPIPDPGSQVPTEQHRPPQPKRDDAPRKPDYRSAVPAPSPEPTPNQFQQALAEARAKMARGSHAHHR